jgi:hypothetical protein
MKLLRTSAVLLAATAAAAAAMMVMDGAHPSTMASPAGHDRGESHETAGSESWPPDTQLPGHAPSGASWVGVFNANWR